MVHKCHILHQANIYAFFRKINTYHFVLVLQKLTGDQIIIIKHKTKHLVFISVIMKLVGTINKQKLFKRISTLDHRGILYRCQSHLVG